MCLGCAYRIPLARSRPASQGYHRCAETERPDGHSVLERQIAAAASFVENVAKFVLMNDSGADFELFICHKITTRPHLTTQAGREQAERSENNVRKRKAGNGKPEQEY